MNLGLVSCSGYSVGSQCTDYLMSKEIELKLLVAPAAVPDLLQLPVLKAAPHEAYPLINRYFDTADRQLSQAGVALRLRFQKGQWLQTLKGRSAPSGAGLHQRTEWEMPVTGEALEWDRLPAEALPAGLNRDDVQPLFETNFKRHAWQVVQDNSTVEVVLDEGHVAAGDRQTPLCEMELELKSGSLETLFVVAETLAAAVPLLPSDISKAERGFALLKGNINVAEEPVSVAEGLRLVRDSHAAWQASEERQE